MDRLPREASRALVVLAVLAVIAALYLLKTILIPVAFALVRLLHALAAWRASCAGIFRYGPLGALGCFCAVGAGRPLPGELDGREPGHGDLHVALGHRAARRPGERADHRPDPRPAFLACRSCRNPARSTGWATPTAHS